MEVALEGLRASAEMIHDTLNRIEGDCDLELAEPLEPDGDEADAAWIEWTTMRGSQKRGPNIADHEDDEDDDPSGQYDEDGVNTGLCALMAGSPGCEISDPGGCEHDGREEQEEN